MTNVEDRTLREQLNQKAKLSRPLTDDEKATLADALNSVADKTSDEKLDYLNLWRIVPNDSAPEYIDRPQITIGELQAKMIKAKTPSGADLLDTIASVASGEYAVLATVSDEIKAQIMEGAKLFGRIYNSQMACLDLEGETGAEVKDGLAAFVAIGIMSQEQSDAITKVKDKNRPETVEAVPLAVELFGTGAFVEAGDLA